MHAEARAQALSRDAKQRCIYNAPDRRFGSSFTTWLTSAIKVLILSTDYISYINCWPLITTIWCQIPALERFKRLDWALIREIGKFSLVWYIGVALSSGL